MARLKGTGRPGLWPRYKVEIQRAGNRDGGWYYGQDTAKIVGQSIATATQAPTRVFAMAHAHAKALTLVAEFDPAPLD